MHLLILTAFHNISVEAYAKTAAVSMSSVFSADTPHSGVSAFPKDTPSQQHQADERNVSQVGPDPVAEDGQEQECPCVTRLRHGVCGTQFSSAYDCYVASTAEEKGSDCVEFFKALQECAAEHPGEFDLGGADEELQKSEADAASGRKSTDETAEQQTE